MPNFVEPQLLPRGEVNAMIENLKTLAHQDPEAASHFGVILAAIDDRVTDEFSRRRIARHANVLLTAIDERTRCYGPVNQ